MKKLFKNKVVLVSLLLAVGLVFVLSINYILYLRKAHSTFDNYYAFRGCSQLVERADDFGICKTSAGQTIKIVKYQNKWFLDGDLPTCVTRFCF